MDSAEEIIRDPTERGAYPRVFGNYLLLQSLAKGGMGEVFLAKSGGIAGIEKHCVVKTLRGSFTTDREYVARFIDEARVVVQLHHRNICQIYDVGRVGKQYYLAMEYVVGRDIRTIQQTAKAAGTVLTTSHILHMATETLEALDYAHRLVEPYTGEPLKLVHRDVSPQNVMVSFEGEVKLIDFGLAQSTKKSEKTQPHVVMGKMAYMAPEQARGDVVDGRADLFAVAVLLYELLVDERFYEGMGFDQIWSVAGRGGLRPRKFDTIDPPLQKILLKALEPDLNKRYPTCADFKEDLVRYQVQSGTLAFSRDMRAFLGDIFAAESAAHREVLAKFQNVRMITSRDPDESQSFAAAQDHESIVVAKALSGEKPLTKSGSTSTPVVALKNDEKTVTSFISAPHATKEGQGGRVDATLAERSPVPDLTKTGEPTLNAERTLIVNAPDVDHRDATVISRRDESDVATGPRATSPRDAVARSSMTLKERTEVVRIDNSGPTKKDADVSRDIAIDVVTGYAPEPSKAKAQLIPIVLAACALVLSIVVGVVVLTKDDTAGRTAVEREREDSVKRDPDARPRDKNDDDDGRRRARKPDPNSDTPADGPASGESGAAKIDARSDPTPDVDAPNSNNPATTSPHVDIAQPKPAETPPKGTTPDVSERPVEVKPAETASGNSDDDVSSDKRSGKRKGRKSTSTNTPPPPPAPIVVRATLDPIPTWDPMMGPMRYLPWFNKNCRKAKLKCVSDISSAIDDTTKKNDDQAEYTRRRAKVFDNPQFAARVKSCVKECERWAAGY